MGVQVHNPVGDWVNFGWALVGAGVAAVYQALNNADDTKYIKCPGSKSEAAVTFPYDTTAVPEGAIITSITIKLRVSTGTGVVPAGSAPSVTLAVAAQDDTSKVMFRTIYPTGTPTTFEVATYQRDAIGDLWDIYRLNQLFCKVFTYLGIPDVVRCYQLFCEIKYRVRPIITVDAPTGQVLTPSPTIAWTYTQADGDPQASATYKIFTSQQVAAVSFNPEKSTPVYQNTVTGSVGSVQIPTSLNANDYVVYVQSVSSFKAKSVWVGRSFSVSGPAPGTPGTSDPNSPGDAVILVVPDAEQGSATLTLRDTSNMLSAQEADSESDIDNIQMLPTNAVLTRETSVAYPGGTSSWKIVASSAATMAISTDWVELDPDDTSATITARAQFLTAATARSVRSVVKFYDADFALMAGTLTGTSVSDATGTWTEASVTGDIPDFAVYAKATFEVLSAANAEVHYVDRLGVMYGDDTPWSSGGHMSRNLLSSWYSSPGGTAQAGEVWTAGPGTTTTTVATSGTGSSGTTCNKMTYVGLSPTVAYRAAGTVFTTPTFGNNYTLNKPAGVVTGDLMIAYATITGYTTSGIVPAGWTLVNTARVSDGSLESLTLIVLKRTAGGSEPASWTDGTFTGSAGCRQAVVIAYSGAADAADQFIAETQAATGNGTPLSMSTNPLVNTDPNAWRVSAFSVSDNNATGTITANRIDPVLQPQISFVGRASAWGTTANQTAFTINKPSGTVTGDLMVATFGYVGLGCTVNVPSGWTLRSHTTANNTSAGPYSMAVMYKVAGGSEPSSFAGSISGGTQYRTRVTQCLSYRNVDATTPFLNSNIKATLDAQVIYTGSASNTDSRAWRISAFGGLAGTTNNWQTTTETIERADDNAYYGGSFFEGKAGNSVMMADSNSAVSTGSSEKNAISQNQLYAAVGFVGFLKPIASVTPVADETARFSTSSIGSANPWLHLRAFDSNGVVPAGSQSLSGIWAPTSGSDKNSMAGWQGLIKPAAAVTAGYALATTALPVDLYKADKALIAQIGKVTATAAFLGSTAGTPYLTVNFYRANQLLQSMVAQGDSFGTGTWVKSAATFDIPEGTSRMTLGVSVSDRNISDIVYWDRASLALGEDQTYRKSTSRDTHPIWSRPQIQYADDYGNGEGYSDWKDLAGMAASPAFYDATNGLAYYVDHTPIPLTNRHYRARTFSQGLLGDQFVSDWGPESAEYTFVARNFWLKDLEHPELNIELDVKWENLAIATTNTGTTFQALGEDLPVVLTEGYKGDTFTVSLTPVGRTDWGKLKVMLGSGKTLFLQSDIDHAWFVRPIGDLNALVLATSQRQNKPLREIKVSFVQVKAPE